MMKLGAIEDEIVKHKVKKVCLKELGIVPTDEDTVTLNEDYKLDGVTVISGQSYLFSENKFLRMV